MNLNALLKVMIDKGASDLHVTAGSPPALRIDGRILPLATAPLTPDETRAICFQCLSDEQRALFEQEQELDLSFGVPELARFRANLFVQRGAVGAVFRAVPFKIRSFEELGLPPVVAELSRRPRGLILVTGPTGSGKSTTLAAIIDKINVERHEHIVTVEDPIEFLHPHKNCLVNQREVGADTRSFKVALKHVLRQDPDVVLIGELRDLETIEAALTVSETGHLAFGTLHTNSAVQTINRILDVFPSHQQPQVRAQLSFSLEGILSQTLIPKIGGKGRALGLEILLATGPIRSLIRDDKLHQIYSAMQLGQARNGMQTLNQSMLSLVVRGLISPDEALGRSGEVEELRTMMTQAGVKLPAKG